MAEVTLSGISKSYGAQVALDDVSLTIPDGAFVVLLGPTGAGKTTTLRMVSGLDKPDGGDVFIGGRDVSSLTPAQRDVAMVFQQYSLYPHLTVRQNLEFPLKSPILKTPQDEIDRKVGAVAEVLQISHKLDNKATALSGGEMQRVSIGRALVRAPSVYLMDEPLSSLDAKLRSDLRIELKSIQADSGATMLYVTHDQTEAMTMATHVGVLDNGKLVQFGSPREIYEDPVSIYAASRLGQPRINVLPCRCVWRRAKQRDTYRTAPGTHHARRRRGQFRATRRTPWATRPACIFRSNRTISITVTDAHTNLKEGDIIQIRPDKPFYFDASGARSS